MKHKSSNANRQYSYSVSHQISYLGQKMGGPVSSLAHITDGLIKLGYDVDIFHVRVKSDGKNYDFNPNVKIFSTSGINCFGYRWSPWILREFSKKQYNYNIIHSHGLWTCINHVAYMISKRRLVPHIITIHGMLAEDALKFKGWKKLPVAWWFQNKALREASCLHATSEKEKNEIRSYGLNNPVAIISMPIVGPPSILKAPITLIENFNIPSKKRVALYLGRLHPVKGIERLIAAWKIVATKYSNWQLVLAGPGDHNYQKFLQQFVTQNTCEDCISFIGPIGDDIKWQVMDQSELFVMPSDFENFGLAIAEAMSAGLPVITTTGTPWECIKSYNAGWYIQPNISDLQEALCVALSKSSLELEEMGKRGRLIAADFSPDLIIRRFDTVYNWLCGNANAPEYIDFVN